MSEEIKRVLLYRGERLFINRNFLLLWSGQTLSTLGDYLFATTLILWVVTFIAPGSTWLPLAVSALILAESLPRFLVLPLAGVFVDRRDKRRVMLWMDACRAMLIPLLLFANRALPIPFVSGGHLSPGWQLTIICAIVFATSVCTQFFTPAQFALIGGIVAEPDLARASGWNLVVANLAMILGPSLAGPLFFGFGVTLAFGLNACSFVISFLLLLLLRSPRDTKKAIPEPGNRVWHEFWEGIHFVAKNKVVRTITIALMVAMFGLGALNVLDVFFLTQNLHVPAALYGYLSAAFGAGSIAGAAIASPLVPRVGFTRAFWISMMAVGILVLVFARMTNLLSALIVFAVLGIPNSANNVALEPLILQCTPRELIGRVFAVLTPAWTLTFIASASLTGYIESLISLRVHMVILGITFGPIDTILTGTGLLVIVGGVFAMVSLRGSSPYI
jgi:MFS family permease